MNKEDIAAAERQISVFKKRYYDYIDRTLDRLCFVFVGQPRYVGSPGWEEHTVSLYSELKKEFPNKPIDLIFSCWEYDQLDRHLTETNAFTQEFSGLPVNDTKLRDMDVLFAYQKCEKVFYTNIENKIIPKIVAKKDVFENYIKKTFHFADSIRFSWINSFDLAEEYNNLFKEWAVKQPQLSEQQEWISEHTDSSLLWLNQHAVIELIYNDHKDYFDSLDRNSVIIRTRYDTIKIKKDWSSSQFTYWNIVGQLMLGLQSQKLQVHNYEEELETGYHNYFNNVFEGQMVDLHPIVGYASTGGNGSEVLKGLISGADYWFSMDPSAFKIYAKRFKRWVFDLPVYRYPRMPTVIAEHMGRQHEPYTVWETAPERMIHDFFISNKFSMMPSQSNWLWENPHFSHYRKDLSNNVYDLHRWFFYDWDKDKVEMLYNYDESLNLKI